MLLIGARTPFRSFIKKLHPLLLRKFSRSRRSLPTCIVKPQPARRETQQNGKANMLHPFEDLLRSTPAISHASGWHDFLAKAGTGIASEMSFQELAETTHYLTWSLTVLAAYHRLGLSSGSCLDATLHLHIAGPRRESNDPHSTFRSLPFVFGTTHLTLIGPDVAHSPHAFSKFDVQNLHIRMVEDRYENFAKGCPQPPTMVVAFNAGLQSRSWLPALQHLVMAEVPTVVTAYDEVDLVSSLSAINRRGVFPNLLFAGRNPFASLLSPAVLSSAEIPPDPMDDVGGITQKAQSWRGWRRAVHVRNWQLQAEEGSCNAFWLAFKGGRCASPQPASMRFDRK
eukprot:gnl/MRDRNA2_/MRDRNA2_64658_c0_seq1.p1 gnl/MRDRNA2_/MRDRNA2_64658_c0~~gnl/MRDRNA2_/MRDRNA2_64658_c0_seq1.p1  ORF type:complete len:340 (+),score=50.68 gnl/MRDRNA2_/MRDRNA2_64658_c0_seq1:54-1073(+)